MLYKPRHGLISAGGFRAHPRYQGCVGHWLLDEGTGLVARDVSGNRNNAVTANTWGNGEFGSALKLSGASQWVSLGTSATLEPSSALSVSARVMLTASLAADGAIVCSQKSASTDGGYVLLGETGSTVKMYLDKTGVGGWAFAPTNTSLALNTWHALVGTWDKVTVRLYLNGILQTTTGAATTIVYSGGASHDHTLGRYSASYWPGFIDDVRIYNRALTATEIESLYTNPFLEFSRKPRVGYSFAATTIAEAVIHQGVYRGIELRR